MQVTVGRIGRPHGIRGDVVVGVRTDEPELRFATGSRLDTDPVALGPLTVAATAGTPVSCSSDSRASRTGTPPRSCAAPGCSSTPRPSHRRTTPTSSATRTCVGLAVRTLDGTGVGVVDDVLHSGQDILVVKAAPTGAKS